MKEAVIIIGHRGAKGHAPENTLKSIEKALEFGVDRVEFDIRICSTGELVAIHDSNTFRTAGVKKRVKKTSLLDLKKLDVGSGEKIPTIEEVFALIDKKATANIDIKESGIAEPLVHFLEEKIKQGWPMNKIVISSTKESELKKIKNLNPNFHLALIINHSPLGEVTHFMPIPPALDYFNSIPISIAKEIGVKAIHISRKLATKQNIKEIKESGFLAIVWTVNTKKEIDKLISEEADGIISDFPDRIHKTNNLT